MTVNTQSYVGEFLTNVDQAMWGISVTRLEKMAHALHALRERHGRLFIVGNGGGAGHASHAACDFRKLAHFDAFCPTDNASWLTAECNDGSWNLAYRKWLQSHNFCSRDGLLVISVGGGSCEQEVSLNIVHASQLAASCGSWIGGIVGGKGGYTGHLATDIICIDPPNKKLLTPVVEGLQAVVWHLLVCHPLLAKESPKWESLQSSSTATKS